MRSVSAITRPRQNDKYREILRLPGDSLDSKALIQVLVAVAPTVAGKILSSLKDQKLTSSEQFMILMAVNAETNASNARILANLDSRFALVEQGIKRSCESLVILLERTK
jgi:hypothetical protein